MRTQITFTGRIPSKKNSTRRVQRGSRVFTMASEAYCEWEMEHVRGLQLLRLGRLNPPYSITYRVYAPDKRRADLSNKIEGINDCLVKAGILHDDNWFLLSKLEVIFQGIDKHNPRIEIEIESSEVRAASASAPPTG